MKTNFLNIIAIAGLFFVANPSLSSAQNLAAEAYSQEKILELMDCNEKIRMDSQLKMIPSTFSFSFGVLGAVVFLDENGGIHNTKDALAYVGSSAVGFTVGGLLDSAVFKAKKVLREHVREERKQVRIIHDKNKEGDLDRDDLVLAVNNYLGRAENRVEGNPELLEIFLKDEAYQDLEKDELFSVIYARAVVPNLYCDNLTLGQGLKKIFTFKKKNADEIYY